MSLLGNIQGAVLGGNPLQQASNQNQNNAWSGQSYVGGPSTATVYKDVTRPDVVILKKYNGYILACGGREYVATDLDNLCEVLRIALVQAAIDQS